MNMSKTIQSLFSSKVKQLDVGNEFSSSTRMTANILRNSSSTCSCGGLAPPAETSGYLYKCIRCDRQFSNISYNLGRRQNQDILAILPKDENQLINMAHYDDAIEMLKKEDNY